MSPFCCVVQARFISAVLQDSDKEELGPVEDEDKLVSEMKNPAEVVVDIESFEESVEKINIALLRESATKENLLRR